MSPGEQMPHVPEPQHLDEAQGSLHPELEVSTEPRKTVNADFQSGQLFGGWRLWLIILLGFGIRLAGLEWGQGYSYFGSGDSLEAYQFAVDYGLGEPRARYLGQPNFSPNSKLPGPWWTVFCFVSMRAWGSIEGAIVATLLLNTVAIYLVWLLADRTLGRRSSFWAALFMATMPFPVYYSAFLYNPNVMPFLGALLFLALWRVVREERSRHIFWVLFLLALMPQFHMSALPLVLTAVILLAISGARLNLTWLAGGVLAGASLYIPYLLGEMAHGWENTAGMMSGRSGHWWGGLKALTAPLNLMVNWVPQWTRSGQEYRELGKACFAWFGVLLALNLVSAIVAVLMLAGAFGEIQIAMRGFIRSPRKTFARSPGPIFLAIIVATPLLFAVLSRQSFHSRYSIVLFAPLFSLAGLGAVRCLGLARYGRIFLAAVVVTVCSDVWLMPAMYRYQGKMIDNGEVFYASLRNLERLYQDLKRHSGAGRAVRVDDDEFMKEVRPGDKVLGEYALIRRYVATRENEAAAVHQCKNPPAIYVLMKPSQVTNGDPAVAHLANGVALVKTPEHY